ncbi:MAG TPA: SUMF1/EgtB/PvdO family nonheme iron enzyme [Candidatus Parabacteroides intestinigallinarum]|uniref:SUMF1/EgtB/PvdO family nonheme iron enzyme n=1 Tax=Candidatus Parabacteroides intestinigallinarum TaxID=2838722 RepID=A0A9D2BQX0_9BACT|nr:SUMF1/EgtB/PvdO family nonheme iron enzyme [Candidatus Parabacteroides intestinigallinarum]
MRTLILIALASGSCLFKAYAQDPFIPTVEIPAGSFYMGGTGEGEDFDEAPVHKVTISRPFRMGQTEVTNAQFEAFRPEHRAYRGKNGLSSGDDEAVTFVSYHDAVAFCEWLSQKEGKTYRLPTEAEWEYACRAGTYYDFYTGDGLPENYRKHQQTTRDYAAVSLRVGQTPPNAFGLYDMHGNVEEWCLDWYGPYSAEEQTDPAGYATGFYRVTRGGSHNTPDKYLRSANRMAMIPEDKHALTGFRVVQAEYPSQPTLIDETPHRHANAVRQQAFTWSKNDTTPFFTAPVPYVITPACGSSEPFFRHNHQPAITWCDNGDLLAAWFSADEENGRGMVVLASRLRAGSDQWEEASLFFKVPDRNMTGLALFNDGEGRLYHLNGVEAAGDWQNLAMALRVSTDNGATWSAPRLIAPEHTKRHQIIAGTIRTREGWLIQACDAGPGSHDGAAIHISKDGGATWHDPWDGAPLPDFHEGGSGSTIAGIHAGVVQLADGSLMALARGNSIEDEQGRLRMPMSLSKDGGKTWEYHASEFPPIDGGQRLVFMRLKEGPLLLISFTDHPLRTPENERGMLFPDRAGNNYRGYGLYAALSFDEGKTWPVRKLLTDGETRFLNGGAWTRFFLMDQTHAEPRGYMAATQTPDGMIHLVSSRLYYRFNLAWLTN